VTSFGTVTIVGVGLIGGSIGRALRTRRLSSRVVGVGRSEARLAEAVRLGVVDEATTDLRAGVSGADVVVVCTPVSQVAHFAIRAAELGPPGVLVTDAGSTKRTIVETVEADERARATFVAAHPIAGSERSGAAHAEPDLFVGRPCVLTPTPRTPAERLERARAFWLALGCWLMELDPAAHDERLALTSHLPHAVASALAGTVPTEALELAAGAYRDGTRVAAADGALWAAIFHENRTALIRALDRFDRQLKTFRRALEADDTSALLAWWETGRQRRAGFRFDRKPLTTGPGPDREPANEH
jgi:prephenate dehydrogenase